MASFRFEILVLGISCGFLNCGAAHAAPSEKDSRNGVLNYGGDGNGKYWPLTQITAENVNALRVVWRRPSVDAGLKERFPDLDPPDSYEATPLFEDGVLYVSNAVGLVEAFDPATGKTIWVQQPTDPGLRGVAGKWTRGLALWRDSAGGRKRIISIKGEYLYALDAATGMAVATFGDKGRVSLHRDNSYAKNFKSSSGAVVVANVIVVAGNDTSSGDLGVTKEAAPEDVRGFDVRTGQLLWVFHIIPHAGEFGSETWGKNSREFSGALGAWVPLTVDQDLGYVYIPTSAPNNSWYGGDHPGQNLFSDSLVCLDARTGKRIWHFQLIHHDMWDYDLASPATLGDIVVNGRRIRAIMQPTKAGFVFVFDRVTGKPVWPIEERAVPRSTVPGEEAWPTQPFPTKPPAIDRQGVTANDLIDFTPELHAQAVKTAEQYVLGPLYTPPSIVSATGKKGTISLPGAAGAPNWGGGAFDPETGMYYITSHTQPWVADLVHPPDSLHSTLPYIHGPTPEAYNPNTDFNRYMPSGPGGLPLVKPPYGRITAINMNTGEHAWMVSNGDGPREHPLLKDLHLPPLGSSGRAAPLLTKTLLFVGEGSAILPATPAGMGGNKFSAYDKTSGRVVWQTALDAGTTGAPISYMFRGKQYIVVAIGSKDHHAELVALALP